MIQFRPFKDDIPPPLPSASFSVLIVEDEALIALEIDMTLQENGHKVAGLVGTVEAALHLLERERPDVAVLDVKLGRQPVFPVAERLRRLNIPYVLSSAYTAFDCQGGEVLTGAENVGKPFDKEHLMDAISRAVARV